MRSRSTRSMTEADLLEIESMLQPDIATSKAWHDDLMARSWVYRQAGPVVAGCVVVICVSILLGLYGRFSGKQINDYSDGIYLGALMGLAIVAFSVALFLVARLGQRSVLAATLWTAPGLILVGIPLNWGFYQHFT